MSLGIIMSQYRVYKQSGPFGSMTWIPFGSLVAPFGSYNTVQFINHCLVK